jgi:hypothetical protein
MGMDEVEQLADCLTVIRGYAQYLVRAGDRIPRELRIECLRIIDRQVTRLDNMCL